MRGRRARRGELDVVVLPRALDEHSPLQRVVPDDLRRIVRPRVDEAGPRARIRPLLHGAEAVDAEGGQFLVKPLRAREQIRIVDAVRPALALGSAARVVENRTQAVGVRGDRQLIQQRG